MLATSTHTEIAMMIIQSSSPNPSAVELAGRSHRNLFIGYMLWLVFAFAVTTILSFLVWRASGRETVAIVADTERQNLLLQTDLNSEKGKVAGLEKAATDAKQDLEEQKGKTASLEKAAADAKADLAKQRERTAKAERNLLEVQERIRPRQFNAGQRALLLTRLNAAPKGWAVVMCLTDKEGCDFAKELADILQEAKWRVDFAPGALFIGKVDPLNIRLQNENAPGGLPLINALTEIGLPPDNTRIDSGLAPNILHVIVGARFF